ncbi:RNA-binding protein NOB1 isoform X2 [Danio rerio]|uniref:RNA-binding protein NOB1 n=1 Tax=Danio rerio TaxID=7955 RepID=A0A8M9PFN4_DANRE|nr:RNA-binding protein NOB1 isoform X2 [Danio rerio]|eukprot:XP_021323414.1 RNA-binding protein NOB1 isoform X2 [Danio rerio]
MVATIVEHVVVDAGAFIKRAPLHEIGKNIYTLKDVVDEIRDKPTKRSLAFLPYKLDFKEPFPEYIQFVTEFAKKTGDYPSLSATDIKVLALTYQLESENVGTEHLKKEPEKQVQICSTQRHPETPVGIAGFHFPSKAADAITVTQKLESVNLSAESEEHEGNNGEQHEEEEEEEFNSDDEEEEEDDEDGGGWITPSNIKQVQMDAGVRGPSADVKVGCVTTDFAMQNVLIQIGLNVLSVNGMLIKNTRSYILRCHACFKTTTNMNKSFCPNCGNNTLKKIAVTLNEDGTMQMHFSRNPKVLNPKGKRYSLPMPQGGKHGNNPHLVEDQRFPQQRMSRKARQKTNVFDPDYLASSSPFSEHDVYSKSASLQLRDGQTGGGRRRTNPNAARKKFVKK